MVIRKIYLYGIIGIICVCIIGLGVHYIYSRGYDMAIAECEKTRAEIIETTAKKQQKIIESIHKTSAADKRKALTKWVVKDNI